MVSLEVEECADTDYRTMSFPHPHADSHTYLVIAITAVVKKKHTNHCKENILERSKLSTGSLYGTNLN
jgi:hypothetical protein